MTVLQNIKYEIVNDASKPLVFAGVSYFNQMLQKYFANRGFNSTISKVEEIENNSQQWFDDHQFICVSSNVQTKRFVTNRIANKNPHYFSILGSDSYFLNLPIGYGTYIEHNTTAMWENCSIGNHCSILSHNQIGHNAHIGDYCHISGFSFVAFAQVGEGNCMALRTSVLGNEHKHISTAKNCNFMTGSIITKDITESATYYGNRRVSGETSITMEVL